MKKLVISSIFLLIFGLGLSHTLSIQAQTPRRSPLVATDTASLIASPSADASQSATATETAGLATPSAETQQRIQERTDKDITETTGKSRDKLVQILDENPIGSFSWYNFLQHGIRRAIERGLPANIVVLILLFPVITSVISFSRHIIGLKGFGVYTPAVLSVAFVSTGIINGLALFLIILISAIVTKAAIKHLNLQYLPRTALLLWGVSIFVLAILIGMALLPPNILPSFSLLTINIFPLLIIMLLTENFMESQLSGSQSEAQQLTLETLIIATLCSLIIGSAIFQRYVILQPELTLIAVAILNIAVGRYSGLRFMEWLRFRSVIE